MNNKDLTVSFLVDQSPDEVFNYINDVSAWWTENLIGSSKKLNDEFEVSFGDVHYSKHRLVEFIRGRKVSWLTTASKLNFIKDKNEWTNTTISFDIAQKGDKTEIKFTHHGLVPEVECYKDCSNAWGEYIRKSLFSLITTGKGMPTPKE